MEYSFRKRVYVFIKHRTVRQPNILVITATKFFSILGPYYDMKGLARMKKLTHVM